MEGRQEFKRGSRDRGVGWRHPRATRGDRDKPGRYQLNKGMSTQSASRTHSPRPQIGRVLGSSSPARLCGLEQDVHFKSNDRVAAIGGDTLKSASAEVRIFDIDAPELDQTCSDQDGKDWPCGRAAQALVARRAVDCALHNHDKFNRIVAICEGLAVNFSGDKENTYAAAEADAQAAKRGLRRGTFQRPADWRQHPRAG